MTTIAVIIPTVDLERAYAKVHQMDELSDSSTDISYYVKKAMDAEGHHIPPVKAMSQVAGDALGKSDILMFVHDDVDILDEGWNRYLALAFSLKEVGLVGLGGAPQLGVDDIYKLPYDLNQLARVGGFRSNMVEWEIHGAKSDAFEEVKALDGFCLAFSRTFYMLSGGWDTCPLPFHMYDAWACCMADKLGFKTYLAPIRCHHAGGSTSTTPEYEEMVKRLGYKDGQDLFEQAHRIIYNEFRGTLPLKVRTR